MPTILGSNSLDDSYEISNSLRFNDADNAHLEKTFSGSPTSTTKCTMSFWIKTGNLLSTSARAIFSAIKSGSNEDVIKFGSSNGGNLGYLEFNFNNTNDGAMMPGNTTTLITFRDPAAWYNFVIAIDTTQGSAEDRLKFYVNGTLQEVEASISGGSLQADTEMAQNYDLGFLTASKHQIGMNVESSNSEPFDGYLSEFYFVDGQQYAPTVFAETDDKGVWIAKDAKDDISFGYYGFYMEFKQTGTRANSSGMGADTSGNDNHFSASGTATTDITTDTPTNSFCVMNPLVKSSSGSTNQPTYSEGNVRVDNHSSGDASTLSTFGVANGKWYFEAKYSKSPSDAQGYPQLGWAKNGNHNDGEMVGFHTPSGSDYRAKNGGSVISNAFDGVPAANDIIGFYLDLDNSTLIVHQNGSDFMGSGASSGIDFSSTSFDPDTGFFQVRYNSNTNVSHFIEFNFGQPSYSISSANADANGHGSFEYNPTLSSTNYLALCTKNLAETG